MSPSCNGNFAQVCSNFKLKNFGWNTKTAFNRARIKLQFLYLLRYIFCCFQFLTSVPRIAPFAIKVQVNILRKYKILTLLSL